MALTGIIIFFSVFCTAVILAGGNIIFFLDIPSIILVSGFITASLLCAGRFSDFLRGIKLWFRAGENSVDTDLYNCLDAFNIAFRAAIGAAAGGFIIGSVLALVNMPYLHKIGPFLAMSCISTLLGMVLAFQVFLPARMSIKKRILKSGE